jgi:UDP-N-acetylmuramoyl-L-alanyl-D-glutamate--2,6-diaminopimelate ligase
MKLDPILNIGRQIIPKYLFKLGQPAYHWLLAFSGNIVYGFPGRKLIVVGVTGTNGKSTTVELINAVLSANNVKSGMISTVAIEVGSKRIDNTTNRTSLGRWQTPKYLNEMVRAGCTHAVIEVASEGLIMSRVWGIPFDVAVFTNLTPEHLNTHKTMENYRNAKGLLFSGLAKSKQKGVPKTIIANSDDAEFKYFSGFPAEKKISFGIAGGEVWANDIALGDKTTYELVDGADKYKVASSLPAKFNIYNELAAYCVGKALGFEAKKIIVGIESVKQIEGRMQKIPNQRGINIYIDYAVTPDAFELLFSELRRVSQGRIISIFGATGDRDKAKRPEMGRVAGKMTNYTILTDEESYSENPAIIVDAIAEGLETVRRGNYEIILNRRDAIKRAIEVAEPGDTVVVTGMGHQKYRNTGGDKKMEWDEAKVITDILKELKSSTNSKMQAKENK